MKLTFLGNWSAKTVAGKRNVSFLVDGKYVFDFGPTTLQTMIDSGLNPNDIRQVFISHLHYDHFAGVVGLLWHRAMSGNEEELAITGPTGIKKTTMDLLESFRTPPAFRIYASFTDEPIEGKLETFKGNHLVEDNAYRFTLGGKTIFYSGDTSFSKSIVEGAENVDLLVHEMSYTDENSLEARMWKHSTVSDVLKVFEESHSRRLIPVHLTQGSLARIPALQKSVKQLYSPEGEITI